MPNQINKGYSFQDNQLVTAANLNNAVDNATLKKGAITEQPALADSVASDDAILISDTSDSVALTPKKVTAAAFLGSGVPVTTTEVQSQESELSIVNNDGDVVIATGYSHTADGEVTVSSVGHALSVGDYISVECTSSSGASGSAFSGKFKVSQVFANSFIYNAGGNYGASSGLCSYKKAGVTNFGSNANVSGELIVGSGLKVESGTITMPSGAISGRPINPKIGEFRYNTELKNPEVYDGSAWREMGTVPFEGSGGDIVLGPRGQFVSAQFKYEVSSGNYPYSFKVLLGTADIGKFNPGDMVQLKCAITEYQILSHDSYPVIAKDAVNKTITLGIVRYVSSQTPVTYPTLYTACTVRPSGNARVHIFTNDGTFTTGPKDGYAEVLVVGPGGNSFWSAPGKPGAINHVKNIKLTKNTVYNIEIGRFFASLPSVSTTSFTSTSQNSLGTYDKISAGLVNRYWDERTIFQQIDGSGPIEEIKIYGGGIGASTGKSGGVGYFTDIANLRWLMSPGQDTEGFTGEMVLTSNPYILGNVSGYVNDQDQDPIGIGYCPGKQGHALYGAAAEQSQAVAKAAGKKGIVIIRYPFRPVDLIPE